MSEREAILAAVRASAAAKNGRPPGQARFLSNLGFAPNAWRAYWSKWRDAILEAGLAPVPAPAPSDRTDEELVRNLADLALSLGHYPLRADRQAQHDADPSWPNADGYRSRLGTRDREARLVGDLAVAEPRYAAILPMCRQQLGGRRPPDRRDGVVRLVRQQGRYAFEVSATSDGEVVHSLETDDAEGIAEYWRRRFVQRRDAHGRFMLTERDVAAFRRRGGSM